jgi:catechol 2,3-dioxygenase-like lactoylglutathione lyase family enzyme
VTGQPPPGPASRLGFFKITVADAEATQRFFEAALGMIGEEPIIAPGFREHVLKTPDGACSLVLYQKDGLGITRGNSYGPISFYVPDIEAALARVVALGGKPSGPTQRFGDVTYVFFETPDGHVVELIEGME